MGAARVSDRIEIDLGTLVFVGVCGDAALFMDADNDEILFRATGTKEDLAAAALEFHRAAAALEAG